MNNIIKYKDSRINKLRILFCIVTASAWALKVIISSLPLTLETLFITGRMIPRLFRVFIYVLLLLTDYKKTLLFLTQKRQLLLLICPIFSLLSFELAIGTSFDKIAPQYLLGNLLFLILFYSTVFFLTSAPTFALCFCSLFFICLAIGNYFVYQFRGRYISYSDIYEITAATAVAGKYKLSFNVDCLISLCVFCLSLALIFLTRKNNLKSIIPTQVLRLVLGVFSILSFVLLVKSDVIMSHIESKPWSPVATEQKYGYLLSALVEIHDSSVQELDGYSVETVNQILSPYVTEFKYPEKEPTIIVIMNESFSDLSVLGNFTTNQDPLSFYHSLSENCVKGHIVASGIGGGTSYTEFESLSGCSQAFISGAAYARYIHSEIPTLVSTLQSFPVPYQTTSIHPEKASNYYRDKAYRYIGFDNSYFIDSFENSETIFDKVTDSANYDFLLDKLEHRESSSPAFLFNVTMQNHGDYSHTEYTFEDPVSVTSFDAGSDVNEFLSLMKMSDDALEELLHQLAQQDEPVILLFFGDHQPTLNNNFYQNVLGKPENQLTTAEEMKKHITPFFIWANYDIKEKDLGILSPNQLSPLLLETANLPLTAYNKYVNELRNTLPVIQSMGYQDKNSKVYTYDEKTPYTDLINEYRMVQYNYLHDTKGRLKQYYSLSN